MKVVTRPRSDVTTIRKDAGAPALHGVVTRPRSDVTTILGAKLLKEYGVVVTRPRSDVTTIRCSNAESREILL